MKKRFFLLCAACAVLLIAGCTDPAMLEENELLVEKQEEIVTSETGGEDNTGGVSGEESPSTGAETFSVSFSTGRENRDTSDQQRSTRDIPDNYDLINYFMLTIRDSEGKNVVNRVKYEKITWSPGFVVSRPLNLTPGTYTLEELFLVRSDNVVLYATPRAGSLMETVVKKSLPVQFTVSNADLTIYTQVIDIMYNNAARDPVAYFGYELGIIDEVDPYYLDFRIFDIDHTLVSEDITISGGDWQITKTINAGGTIIYIPKNFSSYDIEISAADGSEYTGDGSSYYSHNRRPGFSYYYGYSIRNLITDGLHILNIQLTSPVDAQFVVKDESGDDLDIPLKYNPSYPYGQFYECGKESNLYKETINATNSTEIACSPTGYEPFTRVYTLEELKNSETTPIEIQPVPVSVTIPVIMNKPQDLIDATADITIVSTGKTTVLTGIPYDILTSLTFSRASDPVEITISGKNIIQEQNTYTLSQLGSYTDSSPLNINPAATVDFPVMLNKPIGITAGEADIQIVSNGFSYDFNQIPYGTLTPLTISDLTNPVEITVSGINIKASTSTYTIAQLFSYTDSNPLQFSPRNSFQVPLRLYKPSGLPHAAADVSIVSNGIIYTFDDVPYDMLSGFTISDITNPVEITVSGENINQIQNSYTISQLYSFTDSPLELSPSSTASFSVIISKPDLITTGVVDIEVTTNGLTTQFNNVPFGTLTPLIISNVSDSINITISGVNITTVQNSYTLSQLNSYTDSNPIQISPPNAFTIPVRIYRPIGVPHESATLSVVSGGQTQHITVPYNTLEQVTMSGVDNTVEINVSGFNINPIENDLYSLSGLLSFTDIDPLFYAPTNYFGFYIKIAKPAGLPYSYAKATVSSNGHTTNFDVPYDQSTHIIFSDVESYSQLTISGDNIISITRSYSTSSILHIAGETGGDNFFPTSTYTIPFILNKPDEITETAADVRFVSNGSTYSILQNVAYGTLTQTTITDIAYPVNIIVSGNEILELTSQYSLSQVVSFTDSNPIQLTTSPKPPTILSEGFETGLGVWTQDSTDDINWTRYSGGTPSSSTGPSGAYEGTFYLYIESSDPNYPTKNAALISPGIDFDAQSGEFMNMKLHMYGSTMGSITIYYQNEDSSIWTQVGTRSGDQGTSWQEFNHSLDHITGIARIKISGTTGSSYYSDIAIDDVFIGYQDLN